MPKEPTGEDALLALEVWQHDWPRRTISYVDVDGIGPEITNHISVSTIKVIEGSGILATASAITRLQPGTEVSVLPGHKRQYSGKFNALIEVTPALIPPLVTHGDDRLSFEGWRLLRRIYRYDRRERLRTEVYKQIDAHLQIGKLHEHYYPDFVTK